MEGLFGAGLDDLGFHPDLRVFSFEEGEGKPSLRLFETLRESAVALGIAASEIFYLGNDWKKDVLPARSVGFRTGLFAGDVRSLRLGEVTEEGAWASVDAVVTGLAQVAGCLG
jgi:putative hydrolase of the HAD superfamily